ncbi:hypothetical protein PoB_006452700 [Plakobranchus ocellatus]|uniref:Uncharacterized protein n=1 Tax=Plakobranchus ocellatus TaxID=259542 RepID=A0AAV4D1J7_9GAST|nr:hypothetical protein PoB_006452700 [Plakobranchus ocellatus]
MVIRASIELHANANFSSSKAIHAIVKSKKYLPALRYLPCASLGKINHSPEECLYKEDESNTFKGKATYKESIDLLFFKCLV